MQTFLTLEYETADALPDGVDDVRTPRAFVRHFLDRFSDPGDAVFDPFAGFGTTLAVAEEMGREPSGVEYDPDRVALARDRLSDPSSIEHGDARALSPDELPAIDCCLTSPPYMVEQDERDPLQNYEGESDYDRYVDALGDVLETVTAATSPGGYLLVDVSNMKHDGHVTALAWDVAERLRGDLRFLGEVVVGWEGDGRRGTDGSYGYGYDHSYLLPFQA